MLFLAFQGMPHRKRLSAPISKLRRNFTPIRIKLRGKRKYSWVFNKRTKHFPIRVDARNTTRPFLLK